MVKSSDESNVVFNVVWTGTVFTYLSYFVASQMAHTTARFRFVANGCPRDQIDLMEQFRREHPDQVVEVFDVSPEIMVAHGVALDRVRAQRDDGPYFCLIDPDIKANAPFVGEFLEVLATPGVAAVTSGREVWSSTNVIPENHPGVAGEFFFDRDGFVFGSPHLSLYRRDRLDQVCQRWGVGLGSAGPELRDDAKAAMASMGHSYLVYDTAKIVNALLQHDNDTLVHADLQQLVHIGGLAHYLAPPAHRTTDEGEVEPDWTQYESMADRHEVTRYTARTLQALADGGEAPDPPTNLDPTMQQRLLLVKSEVTDLMARYSR